MADEPTTESPRGIKLAEAFTFLALGLVLCAAMFGDALWGRSILAPVDIPPALWSQYRFVDPAADGIPQNHHVVDQISYDLPLQWTVYHAWRRGEIPWWDPFTYSGRPLLADSHVSATDPVRVLCCLALPRFELAYNWTAIAHSLIAGLGLYALLRRWGVSAGVALPVGLLAMCTGANELFLSHPWIPATCAFYPWLWLAWDRLWEKPDAGARVAAPLLAASAIYAGNLQSHAYLPLFAFAFCVGYAGRDLPAWRRALWIVTPTGVIAALLAAPVLGPAIELLRVNLRPLPVGQTGYQVFDGLLLASGLWPWSTGTFRTVSRMSLGFHLFIGSAAFLLALVGASRARLAGPRRCGIAMVVGFLGIMLIPPLATTFYARLAGVAAFGALVLAAWGAETLRTNTAVWRRAAWATAAFAALIALGTAAAVWGIYPRLKPRLLSLMEAHAQDDGTDGRSLPLRRFQVENYPREVGFSNPEVLVAWLALVGLSAVFAVPRWRRLGVPALLALNLASPALFTRRFTPCVPVAQWESLLAGGPLQQQARSLLNPRGLRLEERATSPFSGIFPATLAHLYGVHVVHGYAALVPPNMAWSDTIVADIQFSDGQFTTLAPEGDARFSWIGAPRRAVKIVTETLNTITLEIGDGAAGWLLRTDTRYPGWEADLAGGQSLEVQPEGRLFTKIHIPAGATRVQFTYRPTGHTRALGLTAIGLLGIVAWIIALKHKHRLRTQAPTL